MFTDQNKIAIEFMSLCHNIVLGDTFFIFYLGLNNIT